MRLCQQVYEKNKKDWFQKINRLKSKGKELHHIYSRIGVLLCCPVFWIMLTNREHQDWKIIKQLKEDKRKYRKMVLDNYVKSMGCKDKLLFECCIWCNMPSIKRGN